MKQLKTTVIDGRKYSFADWNVDKATETLAWMVQTIGGAVKPGFESLKNKGFLADVLDTDVSKLDDSFDWDLGVEILDVVIQKLFSKIDSKEYSRRLREILDDGQVLVDGKPLVYDVHFRGEPFLLHKVAFACLKAQYSDFSRGVQSISESSSALQTTKKTARNSSLDA